MVVKNRRSAARAAKSWALDHEKTIPFTRLAHDLADQEAPKSARSDIQA
jgi:hypothetical protein